MSRLDLRFALRSLRRNPVYTGLALVTLVLGIGANAAVFSIVNGVLLSPLDLPDPGRLVRVSEVNGGGHEMHAAWPNFEDWRRSADDFTSMTAFTDGGSTTVLGTSEPLRASVTGVSDGFFRTIAVAPRLGRPLLPSDHHLGAAPVAVVSDGFWRDHLGADPDLAAHPLTVSGFRVQVVGVMPKGFDFPADADIWYPLELNELGTSRTSHNFVVVGRLRPGKDIDAADAQLDAITRRFAEGPDAPIGEEMEAYFPRQASVVPLRDSVVGDVKRPLWILLGAAVLVLLAACTNLGSGTLARGMAREHEYAVRHALGAGRRRIAQAAFGEVAILGVLGAGLALAVAFAVVRGVRAFAPAGLPRVADIGLDGSVVLFTLLITALATGLAGLLPGLRIATGAVASLRGGNRGGDDRRRQRTWKWLIGAEVAFALVLLVGSGLLLRSFRTILSVDPGFRSENVLTVDLDPPSSKYDDNASKRLYYERVRNALETLPGIASFGLVTAPPMEGVSNGMVDVADGPSHTASGDYQLADAGYFRTLGIPLLEGRLFDARDAADGAHVVVVNRAFAELAWPGEDAVGKQMTSGGMDDYWDRKTWVTVVGVVGSVRQRDLTRDADPQYYFSWVQRPYRARSMTIVLRPTTGDASAIAPAVRSALRDVDPDVPVRFATMSQRMADSLATRRFLLSVVLGFAVIALLLAGFGVFGVVSYAVARRRREIGIRMALGAAPGKVRRQLQREYLVAAGFGALAGLAGSLALSRVVASLLYEVTPTDPLTFAAVLVGLGAAAWLASFIPSLRGTRIDPTETMRAQ